MKNFIWKSPEGVYKLVRVEENLRHKKDSDHIRILEKAKAEAINFEDQEGVRNYLGAHICEGEMVEIPESDVRIEERVKCSLGRRCKAEEVFRGEIDKCPGKMVEFEVAILVDKEEKPCNNWKECINEEPRHCAVNGCKKANEFDLDSVNIKPNPTSTQGFLMITPERYKEDLREGYYEASNYYKYHKDPDIQEHIMGTFESWYKEFILKKK